MVRAPLTSDVWFWRDGNVPGGVVSRMALLPSGGPPPVPAAACLAERLDEQEVAHLVRHLRERLPWVRLDAVPVLDVVGRPSGPAGPGLRHR